MQPRYGWLFPVMVLTALSMMAFGVLGIAAITGHLPDPLRAGGPLGGYSLTPPVAVKEPKVPAKVPQLAQAVVPAEAAQPPQVAQHERPGDVATTATLRN